MKVLEKTTNGKPQNLAIVLKQQRQKVQRNVRGWLRRNIVFFLDNCLMFNLCGKSNAIKFNILWLRKTNLRVDFLAL